MAVARAIFCDDIREELGNKQSFMGVYSEHLVVNGYPCVLPKFAVNIWIAFDNISELDSVSVRIDILGEELLFPIEESALAEVREEFSQGGSKSKGDSGAVKPQIGVNLGLSPLLIQEEGVVTVTVITSVGEVLAGRLKVMEDSAR